MSHRYRLAFVLAATLWTTAVWAQGARAQTAVPVGGDEDGIPVRCAVLPAEAQARRAPSTGEVSLLIVRVRFAGDADAPPETDAAGVRAWYARNSYGLLDLQVTEAPLVTLPETRAHYAALGDVHYQGAWVNAVSARLADGGTPRGDFDIVATLAAPGAPFDLGDAAGVARLWGGEVWATSGSELVMVHEIGHTLGLNHARRREVQNGSPFGNDIREYGNPHDAMGNVAAGSFSATSKEWLDWIDPFLVLSDVIEPVTATHQTATVRLRATEGPGSPGAAGGLVLDFPSVSCAQPVRAEFRADLDAVLLHESRPVTGVLVQTTLLDATPGELASDESYALSVQRLPIEWHRFFPCSPVPDARIRVVETGDDADGSWADLRIDIGASADGTYGEEQPRAQLNAFEGGTVRAVGEAVPLSVTVFEPDSVPVQVRVAVEDEVLDLAGPPFAGSWMPQAPGAYSVQARVINTFGLTGTSPRRAVLVEDPEAPATQPVAQLSAPQLRPGEWARVESGRFAEPVTVALLREPVDFQDVPALRETAAGVEVMAPAGPEEERRPAVLLTAEAGMHRLRDGSRLVAGSVMPTPGDWVRVFFDEPGDRVPGVFVSAVGASADDLPPRIRTVGSQGFWLWSDASHPVNYIAVEPALLPSDVGAERFESGVAAVEAGGLIVETRQWFDASPTVYATAIQDAETADSPTAELTPSRHRIRIAVGADASQRSRVAYLVAGGTVGDGPPTVLEGTSESVSGGPSGPTEIQVTVAPNPTRGPAAVLLTLRDGARVQATLLDALGRRVAHLADGAMEAGTTSVPVPGGLPGGVYLVRLRIGDEVRVERFTVVR